jgi:penicillin-binding protein A
MRRVAPRSRPRPTVSPSLRPPTVAFVPLFVGFLGAFALDHARSSARAEEPATPAAEPAGTAGPIVLQELAPAAPASAGPPASAPPSTPPRTGEALASAPVAAPSASPLRAARSDGAQAAGSVRLSGEPALAARLERTLVEGRTPYAATVLLEAHTGRVIAIAEHSTRGPSEGLALRPMALAASVFKIVTTSALLRAGVSTTTSVCTHGGRTRMQPALLVDDKRRDRDCRTFGEALPQSLNVAMAKLALKHLEPDALRAEAARWGFEAPLPLAERSPAHVPDDPFGFANAAAGFGDVKISALHGALIASIVANDGLFIAPQRGDDGERAPETRRVISVAAAKKLREMMTETVKSGTGRRAFGTAPRLGVSAGGKTGSLADYSTGLDTSWFVGFAPADEPEVIVASVVVNTARWHVKAPWVAKEALRAYFQAHPPAKKAAVVAAR